MPPPWRFSSLAHFMRAMLDRQTGQIADDVQKTIAMGILPKNGA